MRGSLPSQECWTLGPREGLQARAHGFVIAATALALATADNKVLRRGVARAAAAHWVAVGAKLVVERNCLREFYPAAFSRPFASLATLGTFAAALFVAMRGDGRDGVR